MSRKIIYPILIVLIVSGLYYFENHYEFNKSTQTEEVLKENNLKESLFDNSFLPQSTSGEIIFTINFILCLTAKNTNKLNGLRMHYIPVT